MLERAREVLETLYQLCILVHPKETPEHLDNASLNRALIVHNPNNSELGLEDYRIPISPSTGDIESPAQADNRVFLPPNGIHYHFKTSPKARVRLFGKRRASKPTNWPLCKKKRKKKSPVSGRIGKAEGCVAT